LATVLVALKPGGSTTTASYDSHGNQISDGTTTYTYDASDRLASTTVAGVTTTYEYDAVDRVILRVSGTTGTYYGYSGFDSAPADTRVNSGDVQQVASLPGGVTDTSDSTSGTSLWSYPDLHGNTSATADDTGTLVGHVINYDPWGSPLTDPVSGSNEPVTDNFTAFGGDGKVTDPDSGITIMGARAYDAAEGRFTSVDPTEGGCANNYVYSFGDPLTQQDLTGNSCKGSVSDFLGVAAGIAAVGLAVTALTVALPVGTVVLLGLGAGVLGTYASVVDAQNCSHSNAACVGKYFGYVATAIGLVAVPLAPESAGAKLLTAKSGSIGLAGVVLDATSGLSSVACGFGKTVGGTVHAIGHFLGI
jgi:RHS repeat-associated protein